MGHGAALVWYDQVRRGLVRYGQFFTTRFLNLNNKDRLGLVRLALARWGSVWYGRVKFPPRDFFS